MSSDVKTNAPSNAIYGLGFLGALVYFISSAGSFWLGIWGVCKAILWPAFLVFQAFKYFAG